MTLYIANSQVSIAHFDPSSGEFNGFIINRIHGNRTFSNIIDMNRWRYPIAQGYQYTVRTIETNASTVGSPGERSFSLKFMVEY